MKYIVILAIILAWSMSAPIKTSVVDNQINFSLDVHENSPLGLVLEGILDPREDSNNKIQAFLKLANQYIPILESFATQENELKYERYWYVQFAGVDLTVYWYFQLLIGWRVKPGSYSDNYFDVTYTPFAWGATYGSVNGTTWPYYGGLRAGTRYLTVYAPVGVQLYREGKICFGGTYTVEPVSAGIHMDGAPKECYDEVIDEILSGVPLTLNCNYISPINITLVDVNLTDTYSGEFIPQTCFNF